MIRPRVIRTLLYKETLRYVHNWGALVVVVALIGLAALITLGGYTRFLPGQAGPEARRCRIWYSHASDAWVQALRRDPPPAGPEPVFALRDGRSGPPRVDGRWVAIDLFAPGEQPRGRAPVATWTAHFWHPEDAREAVLPYHTWLVDRTYRFLGKPPDLAEELRPVRSDRPDVLPLAVTGLVAFAIYLPAFNLFLTSTAEERERRVLLALLLAPVRPAELIASKAIFYALASLLVAATVVGLYRPAVLGEARFWLVAGLAACGYVAIGTVILSFVRRQATIGTASILYLMAVGVTITLAQVLPLFNALRLLLIENYLYRQLAQVIGGAPASLEGVAETFSLALLVGGWLVLATAVFSRRSRSISQAP
ncbi:MAG TPA: ABC transporter permease [Isosphaeraceae bacterium]|jgi:hypothetical protein